VQKLSKLWHTANVAGTGQFGIKTKYCWVELPLLKVTIQISRDEHKARAELERELGCVVATYEERINNIKQEHNLQIHQGEFILNDHKDFLAFKSRMLPKNKCKITPSSFVFQF
jgi:hypothetical protein